jgi:hypothetical protein
MKQEIVNNSRSKPRGGVMSKRSQATIVCTVAPGMFSSEREVYITLADGREISALVDKRSVIVEQEPRPDLQVPGKVKVSLIQVDEKSRSALIDLPQAGFSEGPRVRVSLGQLRQ